MHISDLLDDAQKWLHKFILPIEHPRGGDVGQVLDNSVRIRKVNFYGEEQEWYG